MNKKTEWSKLEPKQCEYCDNNMYHKIWEKAFQFKKRRFCSNICKIKWLTDNNRGKKAHNNRQIKRICVWCSKEEMVSPAYADRPYCSRNCMQKHYASGMMRKENHWHWQGGITEYESRDSLYPGYKEWRKEVYKRDKFNCALCGNNKSGELQAHHIKPVATHKELILDVSNGLTVCKQCHGEIHYGKV